MVHLKLKCSVSFVFGVVENSNTDDVGEIKQYSTVLAQKATLSQQTFGISSVYSPCIRVSFVFDVGENRNT